MHTPKDFLHIDGSYNFNIETNQITKFFNHPSCFVEYLFTIQHKKAKYALYFCFVFKI